MIPGDALGALSNAGHNSQVSVGLPVFNAKRYLPVSLGALLSQTLTDFELIISDNGSTDGTEAMCQAWAGRDPRIRYVRYDVKEFEDALARYLELDGDRVLGRSSTSSACRPRPVWS
jgi:cellulose synthase/poly-beta-1,6-N-acetylglucosamine synthase-like glycosyltransferase